jgi:DNA gyrase subunit B
VAKRAPAILEKTPARAASADDFGKVSKDGYTGADIQALTGIRGIRQNPGMYIGSTGVHGLHHLIWEALDNSLTWDTPVVVVEAGVTRIRPIGTVVDSYLEQDAAYALHPREGLEKVANYRDVKVLAFDEQLRLGFRTVGSFIRHHVNSPLLRVTTEGGRRITITPYHSLFTARNGRVVPIRGDALQEGDFVLAPRAAWAPFSTVDTIDVFNALEQAATIPTDYLRVVGIREVIARHRTAIRNATGAGPMQVRDYMRTDSFPFPLLRALPEGIRREMKAVGRIRVRNGKGPSVPGTLPVGAVLCELLALFAAEGSIKIDRGIPRAVVWSFGAHETALITYTVALLTAITGRAPAVRPAHATAVNVMLDSSAWALVFQHVLGTGRSARDKRLSWVILNTDRACRERAAWAYLAGDGSPSASVLSYFLGTEPTPPDKVTYATRSDALATDVAYLLSSLGFCASTSRFPLEDGRTAYYGTFYTRGEKLYADRLPVGALSRTQFTRHEVAAGARGMTVTRLRTMHATQPGRFNGDDEKLFNADLCLVKVREITPVANDHPYVYDFSVLGCEPGNENFVAGEAPLCAHNSVDEHAAGFGERIWVSVDRRGQVTVRDQGRGIPFDPKKMPDGSVMPTATGIMVTPHMGGKFEAGVYKSSGGLHGVGATVINAFSKKLRLTVWRDGQQFTQDFAQGEPKPHRIEKSDRKLRGTELVWIADDTIFDPSAHYVPELIESRCRAAAYLNKGLYVHLSLWDDDLGRQVEQEFVSREGLADYVRALGELEAVPLFPRPISISRVRDEVLVEAALWPNRGFKVSLESYANGVRTRDGGTHEAGFKAALTKALNDYALKWGVIKNREKEGFRGEVLLQGLTVALSVKLVHPTFQSQTKDRLVSGHVEGIVRSVVGEGLIEWLEQNEDVARKWLRKIADAQKAENEARAVLELGRAGQKQRGMVLDTTSSKKFAGCQTRDPDRAELFIVEGESAGGSAKQGRYSDFQAIMMLKGKPLNVVRADVKRMVENEEIREIIRALGCGTRSAFVYEKLRFNKIIVMADADVDGLHIQTLLLALFYQEFPELLTKGHVYVACPPLYSVEYRGKTEWLLDDDALRQWQKKHKDASGVTIRRYKGLGEMTPRQLRETTMDPARRVLKRVTIDDALTAAKLVSDLMDDGPGKAEARRTFLAHAAAKVTDLDV